MQPLKYLGRTPRNDSSVVTKGYVDSRYEQEQVTPDYIDGQVRNYALTQGLVDRAYIDDADSTRAKKEDVDHADSNYLPLIIRGLPGGAATLDAARYIPASQVPSGLKVSRGVEFIDGVRQMASSATISSTNQKAYLAATVSISDPGYPYQPLPIGRIRGNGSSSTGAMRVFDGSDRLHGGGVAAGSAMGHYSILPAASTGQRPFVVTGGITLRLYLSLRTGSSYTFSATDMAFFALLFPAST